MLRFLAILALLLSLMAYAGKEAPKPKLSKAVKSLIQNGKANGLKEVNNGPWSGDKRYRDNSGLIYVAPHGGWVPNFANYGDRKPSSIPEFFYRTVRDCKTKAIIDEQVIFTYNGYSNYIGGSRYEAQCVLDGTEDTFYEESDHRLR